MPFSVVGFPLFSVRACACVRACVCDVVWAWACLPARLAWLSRTLAYHVLFVFSFPFSAAAAAAASSASNLDLGYEV